MCLANGPRFLEAEISRSVIHWLALPETVAEIKRILEENIAQGRRNLKPAATLAPQTDSCIRWKKPVTNDKSVRAEYHVI